MGSLFSSLYYFSKHAMYPTIEEKWNMMIKEGEKCARDKTSPDLNELSYFTQKSVGRWKFSSTWNIEVNKARFFIETSTNETATEYDAMLMAFIIGQHLQSENFVEDNCLNIDHWIKLD